MYKTLLASLLLLIAATANAEVILEDLHGTQIPVSTLKGKWVVLNYWAPWCKPCQDEIPILNKFYESTPDVAVFGINYDRLSIEEQQELATRFNLKYQSLLRESATSLHLGNIDVLPATFIINPAGKISERIYGKLTAKTLQKAITKRYRNA